MNNNFNGDYMHGSIFVFLKRFVENSYDFSTWIRLSEETGINRTMYQMNEMYPVQELTAVVEALSTLSGKDKYQVLEEFGTFLVTDLLLIFKKFVDPSWGTFEMIQYTEQYLHGAVRRQDERTNPPRLFVTKVNKNLLVVDYYSKRRMASIAVGIIKGITIYFNEAADYKVWPVTDLEAERVQIRLERLQETPQQQA
ncbi:heme NO-binding domain-containing protein [Pontibacter actiniarum]|nr:heme NO-binding domain-containing protein [Pontibacter actiniarum]